MKLAIYTCDQCGKDIEEIFNDTEEQPDKLDKTCPLCGGFLLRGKNWKNNCQVWKYNDGGGL